MDLGIILYRMKSKLYDFRNLFTYNLYGRIRYGFDIRDTWNLDYTIAKFIYPRLKYYRDIEPQGYPACLDSKEYIEANELQKYVLENADDNHGTWLNILDTMVIGFRNMGSDEFLRSDHYEANAEALRLFSIFAVALWD